MPDDGLTKKILIIEDEVPLLKILVDECEREQFAVLAAKNGEEGLAMAIEHKPDLILLDIVMPKMDGMTMLERLRAHEWGANANVLILSNLNDIDKLKAAVGQGVYEFIVKTDWSLKDIMARVKTRLDLQLS